MSKISGKKKKTEKRKKYKLWARRVLTKGGRAQGTPAVSKITGKREKWKQEDNNRGAAGTYSRRAGTRHPP